MLSMNHKLFSWKTFLSLLGYFVVSLFHIEVLSETISSESSKGGDCDKRGEERRDSCLVVVIFCVEAIISRKVSIMNK